MLLDILWTWFHQSSTHQWSEHTFQCNIVFMICTNQNCLPIGYYHNAIIEKPKISVSIIGGKTFLCTLKRYRNHRKQQQNSSYIWNSVVETKYFILWKRIQLQTVPGFEILLFFSVNPLLKNKSMNIKDNWMWWHGQIYAWRNSDYWTSAAVSIAASIIPNCRQIYLSGNKLLGLKLLI